jgi:UDP-glucuronate 4-epimerase
VIIDRQPPQPGDVPQTFADISKARALLGYDPKTPIEAGLRLFVDWFRMQNS